MSNSAIFHGAPSLLRTASSSAIALGNPRVLRTGSASAIFSASGDDAPSVLSAFGSTSSAPYVEDYASATVPLGPISSDTYINFIQNQVFGPTSSDEYQTVADRGPVLRGAQFSTNTIALDRFATPLAAVLNVFEDLDLTTAATTTIYTVPAGSSVIVLGGLIRIKAADTVTTDAEVSIGINPSTTDVFAAETLVDVQSQNDFWSFWKDESAGVMASEGAVVDLDVSTSATATTLNSDIYLIGLLL
jgi:hypothetical protein